VICGRLLVEGLSGEARDEAIAAVIAGERQLALAACGTHTLRSPEDTSFVAERGGAGWKLSGRMPVVLNGDRADVFLVAARTAGQPGDAAGVTLLQVPADAAGLSRRNLRTIDLFGAAELVLDGVEVAATALVGAEGEAVDLINLALDFGIAAICAEAVGSMEYLIPATAEYTRTRIQYGAPLAKFQVLQHRMADMYIQTQTAKSIAMVAAMALDGDPVERRWLVSAAKAQVGRSAKFVGSGAVQLHGGMGVSEELDIGHHFIRLNTINQWLGDGAFHLKRFGELAAAAA
jgi:alkylation response protein AidB-like acyl-CoA dehydrogenase